MFLDITILVDRSGKRALPTHRSLVDVALSTGYCGSAQHKSTHIIMAVCARARISLCTILPVV